MQKRPYSQYLNVVVVMVQHHFVRTVVVTLVKMFEKPISSKDGDL
jgi:hypothetical protein